MTVTREIIDGKEYFHLVDEHHDLYIGNFAFGLECTSKGVKVIAEFDAWGRSFPYCCYAEIALWVNGIKHDYTNIDLGACSQPPMIYYDSGFRISETKSRYRIVSNYVGCAKNIIFAVYDRDAGWFVPLVSWEGFRIFQLRPVKSVETNTGYSITYEIYNYSKRACKLPVLIRYLDTFEVIGQDIVTFSEGQLKVTKTYGADKRVRAYAYKPNCSYTYDGDSFYAYLTDPSTLATELVLPEVMSKITATPDKKEIESYPGMDVTLRYTVENNSNYSVEVTLDLTVNGSEVNVPKTARISAGGSETVQWTLHFSDYGSYEVCPKILGVRLL